MYDFFAQASSLHTNEQARAIKFYVEPSSVQINRASILELSVHSKCPVGGLTILAFRYLCKEIIANLAQLVCIGIAGIIMVWRLSEFDNRARQQNADSVQTPWLASASASFMMFMHAS